MSFINKILSSKFVNSGVIGKVKDHIYFNYISPKEESKTDVYRKEILDIFMDVYDKEDWILAFGSALRFYRDNTMSGQDVDIVMRKEDFELKKEQLKEKGFSLVAQFKNSHNEITEYKLKYKEAEVDIFFLFEKNNTFFNISNYIAPHQKDSVVRDYKEGMRIVTGEGYCSYSFRIASFECETYTYEDMKFKSYKDMELNLENTYGKSWRTPNPKHDPIGDAPHLIDVNKNAVALHYDKPRMDY